MSKTCRRVTVCRSVSFSSGHRYFNPDWSEEENAEVYGSSHTASGHGHNFVLEAYLDGRIDPTTGMVVNLKDVDGWLRDVTEPLDHHFLNDVPWFKGRVPTAENIAVYCFENLMACLTDMGRSDLRLRKIRLYEGRDCWVDCVNEEQGCE